MRLGCGWQVAIGDIAAEQVIERLRLRRQGFGQRFQQIVVGISWRRFKGCSEGIEPRGNAVAAVLKGLEQGLATVRDGGAEAVVATARVVSGVMLICPGVWA